MSQQHRVNERSLLWKILTNPLALILCFFIIIVAGKYMATLFFQNILGGLSHGYAYSWMGILAVVVLLINYVFGAGSRPKSFALFNLLSILLMLGSIFIFFRHAPSANVEDSFLHPVAIAVWSLFAIVTVCFILRQLMLLRQNSVS